MQLNASAAVDYQNAFKPNYKLNLGIGELDWFQIQFGSDFDYALLRLKIGFTLDKYDTDLLTLGKNCIYRTKIN